VDDYHEKLSLAEVFTGLYLKWLSKGRNIYELRSQEAMNIDIFSVA
jgi:hypothetical protein